MTRRALPAPAVTCAAALTAAARSDPTAGDWRFPSDSGAERTKLDPTTRLDGDLNDWHPAFAHVVVMSRHMVAVFLLAQRMIVSGFTGGAVK
ncbi:hypothetical protein ACW4TU_01785 [Streptomyces sp. QTS52]